jgi:5-methylcytosine-specific restriction endonuclease McrA
MLPNADTEYQHEIDHVIAIKHGGTTVKDNLVLACLKCNRNKGSDVSAIDPIDGVLVGALQPPHAGLG